MLSSLVKPLSRIRFMSFLATDVLSAAFGYARDGVWRQLAALSVG